MVNGMKKIALFAIVMAPFSASAASPVVASKGYVDSGLVQKQNRLKGQDIIDAAGHVALWGANGETSSYLEVDSTVTAASSNLVTSGAVNTALTAKQGLIGDGTSGTVITNTGTAGSVSSLSIDSAPTAMSNNLVTSGGVQAAIANAVMGGISGLGDLASLDEVDTSEIKDGAVTLSKIDSGAIDSTSGGTSASADLITSGAVHSGLAGKQGLMGGGTAGTVLTNSGTAGTVNSLSIDTTVTNASSNLVTSGAVESAIATAVASNIALTDLSGTDGVDYDNLTGEFSLAAGGVTLSKIDSGAIDSTSGGTSASSNLITSGAVHSGLATKQGLIGGGALGTVITNTGTAGTISSLAIDTTVTSASNNLVTSGAVDAALATKADATTCLDGQMLMADAGSSTGFVCIDITTGTYSEI